MSLLPLFSVPSLSRLVILFACVLALPLASGWGDSQEPDLGIVKRWLATDSGAKSLKIDFSQVRKMRTLKLPIRQEGSLWLDYGNNRFRWETGERERPDTVVVNRGKDILILRTRAKKYEIRPAGSGEAPGMVALANGFPRTLAEFKRDYRVIEIQRTDNTHRIVARPRKTGGRGIDTFTFVVDASNDQLSGIEIDLEDGSSIKTVFSRVQINAPVPSSLFEPDLTGYKQAKF